MGNLAAGNFLGEEIPQQELIKVDPEIREQLSAAFDTFLTQTQPLIDQSRASQEPLCNLATKCFTAFAEAAHLLTSQSSLPYFSGNNPHDLDKGFHHSPLTNAISTAFGIRDCYAAYSPNAVNALRKMQPIANELHRLAIFS